MTRDDIFLKFISKLDSISTFLNFRGAENQTISAKNWDLKRNGKFNFVFLIDPIFYLIDKDHCFHSWIYWKYKKDLRTLKKKHLSKKNQDLPSRFYYYQE